ncbi:ABC transporter substrate-binding protein [Candidatus Gracilibacteria bacterium]|nr:ABC transporter substrate-binding protein [Candidatus Gracilibacteria bacterium]
MAYDTAGIINVEYPVNLEKLATAQPDLIVAFDFDVDANQYEKLSAIAPTVVFKGDSSGQWRRDVTNVAEALGMQAEAANLFADYEARLATFRATVGTPADIEVSIVRVQPDNQVMMNLVNSFPSQVVADAGLGRPASQSYDSAEAQQRYQSDIGATISLEQVALADGDLIFVWGAQAKRSRARRSRGALAGLKRQSGLGVAVGGAGRQGASGSVAIGWVGRSTPPTGCSTISIPTWRASTQQR